MFRCEWPLACAALVLAGGTALSAIEPPDPDLPAPGLYWQAPRPDGLDRMTYPFEATLSLWATTVDLPRVSAVRFHAGGTLVGEVTDPPYRLSWTADSAGEIVLQAQALSGTTVLATIRRTVKVVGTGLHIRPNIVEVQLPPEGTTTCVLDLRNLGPTGCDWAAYVQGGDAPGGDAGAVDRVFENPNYENLGLVLANQIMHMTYVDRGTDESSDDEIWLEDREVASNHGINTMRRRRIADWSDAGVWIPTDMFISMDRFNWDRGERALWGGCYTQENGSGMVKCDATNGEMIQHFFFPRTGVLRVSRYLVGKAPGVIVTNCRRDGVTPYFRFCECRDRDGALINDHGTVPPFETDTNSARHLEATCWAHGFVWAPLAEDAREGESVQIYRWRPGMPEALPAFTLTRPHQFYLRAVQICGAAEPGFLWVACNFTRINPSRPSVVLHIDTGYRPWLQLTTHRGSLANAASETFDLNIDATGVAPGVYQAVVAFTQYPHDELPQIRVPVTLVIGADGTRTITIGADPTNPLWIIAPEHGSIRDEGDHTVFEDLRPSVDYTLTPLADPDSVN